MEIAKRGIPGKVKGMFEKYQKTSEGVKATLWYTICNVISKGFALITTPLFTRLLTEEEFGTFSIFQSWYSILIIFTSFNIFLSGYTKGLLLYKGREEEYTSASLMQTTCITFFLCLIYMCAIPFWTNVFDLEPHLMVGLLLELMFMPALEFWSARMRFEYRYKPFVAVTLGMSALGLAGGLIAVILSSYKLEARVYSDVAAKVLFSSVIFFLLLSRGKIGFKKEYWAYNFKFNLPLIPHYLSNYVLSQSDRLMIGKMVGKGEAAFYSVAYTIATMMNLITMAINSALTPFLYKSIEKKQIQEIKKVTRPVFYITAALSILTMAFAPEIIWLFGRKYMDAIYVIPPIAASVFFIFVYAMFSSIEYYYQKTGWIAIATTISAGLNFVLNLIFIHLFGYYAAGYTTLVCYVILAIAHYTFYRRILKDENMDDERIYDERAVMITSIAVIVMMLLMALIYQYFLIRYAVILVICILAVVYRNAIKAVIMNFKK